jgi:hypothetical protein
MKTPLPDDVTGVEPLAPDVAARVTMFARACKAAARTVALYPPEHPAVGTALDAITSAAHVATGSAALRLAVLPETLSVDGRHLPKADPSVAEFAALLHSHQVGQLIVHPLTDADLWRRFLALLALSPDQTRLRGGLGRLWTSEGQPRIEVRSLDYRELLRSQLVGDRASWDRIVAGCLDGDLGGIDEEMLDLLFGVLDDPSKVKALVGAIEARVDSRAPGSAGGGAASADGDAGTGRGPLVLAGLLHAVARYVEETRRDRLDQVMTALADAAGRLPVGTLQPMLRAGRGGGRAELARFVKDLTGRMTDGTIANMVAAEVRGGRGTSRQLADAFCGLAPDANRRTAILTLARASLAPPEGPAAAGLEPALTQAWQASEELLLTYSDQTFVSDEYNAELQRLASRAVEIDRDQTDPPDRLDSWRGTVNEERVRGLDAELLVDLMHLQTDAAKWRPLADLALSRVNVLLVMGDFAAAAFLIGAIRQQAESHADPSVRDAGSAVIANILTPGMMRHVASHLDTSDRRTVDAARRFCEALGTGVVSPLAEVLSREERARPRQHLIGLLIGFGPSGRQAVERLRQSPNAAVRRTAVLLLREFGGHDALGELESLLSDSEPHVQREATLAIAMMGIEAAFQTLTRALTRGSDQSASSIMGVIWTLPEEEARPLLAHLVQQLPYRGALWSIHARAIPRLGALGGHQATLALAAVLDRRQMWAPFRLAAIHKLALSALAAVGSPDAWRFVEQTATGGSRRLRSTARALMAARTVPSERKPA